MTGPGGSRARVTVAPATMALATGAVAAGVTLWAPLVLQYALLVGWLVGVVTFVVLRGR